MAVGVWTYFHWNVLLAWEVLGWVIGTALAVGGLLLFFDQFVGANVCFVVMAVFIFAKIMQIAISSTSDPSYQRMMFTFLLSGILGLALVEVIRGVNRKRHIQPIATAQKPSQTQIPLQPNKSVSQAAAARAKKNAPKSQEQERPPHPLRKEPEQAQSKYPVGIRVQGGHDNIVADNVAEGGTIEVIDSPNTKVFGNIVDLRPWATFLEEHAGKPQEIEEWLQAQHAELEQRWAPLPQQERQQNMKLLDQFDRAIRQAENDKTGILAIVEKLRRMVP